jgi:transcriptional/translational regulatory protein YebC/TACO1
LPSSTVTVDSLDTAKAVLRVMDALDDHDDVQEVYANVDIPDELMAELG